MAISSEQKVILVVLAHPDDESFGMGGTIAFYSSVGVKVHLLCATRGEAGTVDPEFLKGFHSIAELRESELACAAKQLGLASVTYLGFRDSGMAGSATNNHPEALAAANVDAVAGKIESEIQKLHPQVVVTFDPVGGYHHPDHIAIHNATVKAFELARSKAKGSDYKPQFLYYNALNRRRLRVIVALLRLQGKDPTKMGRNKDIDLVMLTRDADTPPHVTINYRSVQKRKDAADACHASQQDARFTHLSLTELYYRIVGRVDRFTRAFPLTDDSYRSTDLFA